MSKNEYLIKNNDFKCEYVGGILDYNNKNETSLILLNIRKILRNYGICIDWDYEYIGDNFKCYKRVKCISIIFDKVGMFNINKNLYDVNSLDDLVIE